jgi:hypothetical protein
MCLATLKGNEQFFHFEASATKVITAQAGDSQVTDSTDSEILQAMMDNLPCASSRAKPSTEASILARFNQFSPSLIHTLVAEGDLARRRFRQLPARLKRCLFGKVSHIFSRVICFFALSLYSYFADFYQIGELAFVNLQRFTCVVSIHKSTGLQALFLCHWALACTVRIL